MTAATQTEDPRPILANPASRPDGRKADSRIRSILRQLAHCLMAIALAGVSYFVISHFLLQYVRVVGRSMLPTLHDSDSYLLNRWIYYVHSPRHSDVVVLRDPSDNGFSVKRVIATPGDMVLLKDGKVYINGCKLEESYLLPGTRTFINSEFQDKLILCGKDQYFLLGDNRGNSIDSRTYGLVPRRNILGPIVH